MLELNQLKDGQQFTHNGVVYTKCGLATQVEFKCYNPAAMRYEYLPKYLKVIPVTEDKD